MARNPGVLRDDFLYLHDVDITVDCRGNICRQEVYDYLINNGVDNRDILNDLSKVGNNCISWRLSTSTNIPIRCKLYNKFVQIMESSEVRVYIGSRIYKLVADESMGFRDALRECKDYGMTRLEIKVFSSTVFNLDEYRGLIQELLTFLDRCPVHRTSFEMQWMALVDEIQEYSVLAIYISNKKIFSYCHWYNSITKKKQGCIREGVEQNRVMDLLTDYSFNRNEIILMEFNEEVDGSYTFMSKRRFRRLGSGITFVPGPRGSLAPRLI